MSTYSDLISNDRKGFSASAARVVLQALSLPYRCGVGVRNWFYDRMWFSHRLGCPCISIGNLTTGGTGKTPLVIWLASELIRGGRKVAVLSRGYKSDDRGPDELRLLSQACPQAVCIAHPDRVRAGQYAIQEHQVDVILLDDAFQHRRIDRDLDIALLDASCPFGHDHLLPRGLLRESAAGLRRADLIVFTRLSQTTPQQLSDLKERCHRLNPDAGIIACDHEPGRLVGLDRGRQELSLLEGKPLLAFAGIGNPQGFVHTLTRIGAKPLHMLTFSDHHRYTAADCDRISRTAGQAGAEMLVTTEKDMVKLSDLKFAWPMPLFALAITIDFVGEGAKILLAMVNELFSKGHNDDGTSLPTD